MIVDDDFLVTVNDIRKTGHCTRGMRRWFEMMRLDFAAFLKNGIAASALLATGDGMAETVVARIRAQNNG